MLCTCILYSIKFASLKKLCFRDFSTLMRTEDAFMSNVGKTNVIEAGVGLSTTELNYEYKVK